MDSLTLSMNTVWVLVTGFLVFFMQAGFALVETGFTRAKNVSHTMMMNMMVFCIGAIGYFICGFAFQFGGVGDISTLGGASWGLNQMFAPGGWGLIGLKGFFLAGLGGNLSYLAFFLFQMVFMDTAATIPTGAMAERLKFSAFVVMSLWVSMVIYPIFGSWVWGGGWLSGLGRTLGFGHGAVDFAGSSVVHMVGGMVGLAGALVIGPRIGKFNKDGSSNSIPGHNIPMAVLGTIILFFGWFGFNPGSTLSGVDAQISMVAVNTLLAGAMGGITAMLYMWWISPLHKPEPGNSVNGILAGLVAVTAPCAFIDPWAAVLIGGIAGVIVCISVAVVEKRGVDDPVGAVSVHGVNGAWGILALGLFANGSYGDGWNGVSGAVRGLFYGDGGQLLAQSVDVVVNVVFVFGLSYLFFKLVDKVMGLRSKPADEINGLDVPEMGTPGYADDEMVKQPGALPRSKVPEMSNLPVTGK